MAQQAKSDSSLSSFYITMPDGVKIAADLRLPKQTQDKVPTLLELTRYWRSTETKPINNEPSGREQSYLDAGYAYVMIDVRGTGASFGTRFGEFSLAEVQDYQYIIDWISKQSWSNGNVAAIGVSYTANTAELTALYPHPALKVAVPLFTDYDWFESIILPGGIKNRFISERWAKGARALDLNDINFLEGAQEGSGTKEKPRVIGVRPVDGKEGRTMLAKALKVHEENTLLEEQLLNLVYRDELPIADKISEPKNTIASIHRFQKRYEEVALPMFQRGSWFDAGTAAGILDRFINYNTPYHYEIGPWSHGAEYDANPYNDKSTPVQPTVVEQYNEIFKFIDPFVRENRTVQLPSKSLHYFTIGSNIWKQTDTWPPKGHVLQRWWFNKEILTQTKPVEREAEDTYTVNYDAGTGNSSRWATQLGGGDVYYPDRSAADKLLLTYTSKPLPKSIEITGTAIVSLEVSSTHTDGAFIVYLEDVDQFGYVRMLTEGGLRAIHRKISTSPDGYKTRGPYHSFLKADAQPLIPDEIANLSFALLPMSVQIAKGHSLRISIAGHDKDTFIRIPTKGEPIIKLFRNSINASFIDLPVIANSQ